MLQVNEVPARQRDVAMVFQNYALYPHMTVAENLAFGLRMRQTDTKSIRARIETVAQSLDITHLLYSPELEIGLLECSLLGTV